jgi:DNA-directed RNA polymerase specialized sigma54-like protein
MADESSNPFKAAPTRDEGTSERAVVRITPFKPAGGFAVNPVRDLKMRRIADMELDQRAMSTVADRVKELTVSDLEDLAKEVTGIPTRNDKIASLTIEDLQDLEGLFFEYKRKRFDILTEAGRAGTLRPGDLVADNVDCCCCTPCCCCAAVETDPFDA